MGYTINSAKAIFYRESDKILYHLSGNPSGGSHIAHDLTVRAIHGKGNPDPVAIETEDLKAVRTPAHVACQRNDLSGMEAVKPSGALRQEKVIDPHDPVYSLMIYPVPQFPSETGSYSPIPVGRSLIGNLPDPKEVLSTPIFFVPFSPE